MFRLPSNLIPIKYYSPEDTDNKSVDERPLNISDSIELMGEDDDESIEITDKDKRTPDKKNDREVDEAGETKKTVEDEIEADLEEEVVDEEKLELVTPVRRKEILAKYPTLFKDFPALEKAYYREGAYSEILPTIDDAKQAVEKAGLLDEYGQQLSNGDSTEILKSVKQANPDAFLNIVDNYLPNLFKVDESAYYNVVGNLISHTVATMITQGTKSDREDLVAAANIVNEFIFGTKELRPLIRLSKVDSSTKDEVNQVEQREQEFIQRQAEATYEELDTKITNILKSTIDKNIDPNESMTDYVRKNASREARENLTELIEKDSRFQSVMAKLWDKAVEENYSRTSQERIRAAFLSKAKTLLPEVIKKARNEALKGLGKKVQDGESNKGHLPVGNVRRTTSNNSGKTGNEKVSIPNGMRSIDFLMQD